MIKLESGREITLEALRQEKTYASLLVGVPRTMFNNEIIERWRKEVVPDGHQGLALIEPVRRPGRPGISMLNQPDVDERLGPPELLPAVVCVGLFRSTPVRNERGDFSLLNILWFQERFALPIDSGVVARIQKLDWENLAYNSSV